MNSYSHRDQTEMTKSNILDYPSDDEPMKVVVEVVKNRNDYSIGKFTLDGTLSLYDFESVMHFCIERAQSGLHLNNLMFQTVEGWYLITIILTEGSK